MCKGIVAGGNFIVDYVKTIDAYPAEQTLAYIKAEYTGSGGGPYNVLRGLRLLGSEMPLAVAGGRVGNDAPGKYVLADLDAKGIERRRMIVDPTCPTSYTLVMATERTGRRTFFHQSGANAELSPNDFDLSGLAGHHLHYGYLLLLEKMDAADSEYGTGAARVLAQAKASDMTVSVDLVSEDSDRFREFVPHALRYCDLTFMNEFEVSRLSGVEIVLDGQIQIEELVQACETIQPAGTLLVHWSDGVAAYSSSGGLFLQGSVKIPAGHIASVAGSGDAFAAGFLLGWTRGDEVPDCLKLGVCAAASSIKGFTCTDAIRLERECMALGDSYGYRETGS